MTIPKILVHAPDKSSGEREQEIEIYLKFIGKFDVPLPEPTPEEIAAEEERRKRHEAYRRSYEKKKERLRQEKLAAEQTAQAVQEEADPVTEPKEEQKTA